MNREKLLSVLDKVSFILLVFASFFIVSFQTSANIIALKLSVALFALGVLALVILLGLKCYYCFEKKENKDEEYNLSKNQKIWLIIKTVLSFFVFCWIIFILLNIKQS